MKDKVVIVTGASSGIGRSLAVKVCERGAIPVLVARSEEKLKALSAELHQKSYKTIVCTTDIANPVQVDQMIAEVVKSFGRIDVLINNAGVGHFGKIMDTPLDELRKAFETNFFAPVSLLQKVFPIMKNAGRGEIVNISSTAGFRSWPNNGFYSATKHALNAVTESLFLEMRNERIKVLLVMPGVTNTSFLENSAGVVPAKFKENPPKDMTPDQAAEEILQALEAGKRRIVLTTKGKILYFLNRLSPGIVDYIFSRG